MRYFKKDFDGNLVTKAYMLGFRIGDLNVYRKSKNSETIIARCHTTHKTQVVVMKKLFSKYGRVNISVNSKKSYHINCFLNKTFDFLIQKGVNIWNWVPNSFSTGIAFISGYTDAEGNYIINQGRARFKIDSFDFDVLHWMSEWLRENSIYCKLRLLYRKDTPRYDMNKNWNNDLWRLNINDKNSLYRFIITTQQYSIHKKRIKDAMLCKLNIEERNKYA